MTSTLESTRHSYVQLSLRTTAWLCGVIVTASLAACTSDSGGSGPDAGGSHGRVATAAASTSSAATTVQAAPTPLDGTYAVTWTVADLAKALGGDSNPDAAELAANNAGTITLTLDKGRYDMVYEDVGGDSCPGTFVVDGSRVVLTATNQASEWDCGDGLGERVVDAAWTLSDRGLTLTDWKLPEGPGLIWFSKALLGTKLLQRVP